MNDEYRIEYFKGKNDKWYWRRLAANGEPVADGGQGYTRKESLLESVNKQFPDDAVEEVVVEIVEGDDPDAQ